MSVDPPAAPERRPAARPGHRPERPGAPGPRPAPRIGLVLAAVLVALAAALVPAGARTAAAASDDLALTTAATYTVSPSNRVIHVAIDVTARNNKPNVTSGGIITRYFYDGARLAIHPEARNVAARDGRVRLKATTSPADGYLLLDVRFRASIFFHQTAKVHVTYDLPAGKPRSASDIRVGTAFVTFVAWAFGDRGSVRVDVPASFDAETTGSTVTKTKVGATTVFRATGITGIDAWYLVVTADRPSALTQNRIDLPGGEHLVIRAWPEDTAWSKQVTDLLTKGLPELVEQTGLDWPVTGDINVFEVHTPLLEGYAGIFFAGQDKIEISEDLDDLTIIHEASHAWFNSDLFSGRWINEGFADTYASWTLHSIGAGEWAPDRLSPTDKNAVKLNDWVHPGRITDDETQAREQFGYEAAWTVVRSVFSEIGSQQMRHVLNAAAKDQIAYAGAGEPETVSGTTDWRRLLDLLEEVGKSKTATDVFREWVVTADQARELDTRAAMRTRYATLVADGGDWRPPFYVRKAMSDWEFSEASVRLAEAHAVLERRDAIAAAAAGLGLTPPAALGLAYAEARDSLDGAIHLADSEIAALNALAVATQAVGAPRAPFVTIGLIGETPEAALAAAREAFTAGAPDAAGRATAVTALIDGSVAVGRSRLTTGVAILAVVIVALIVLVLVLRRRRPQRRAAAGLAAAIANPVFGPERPADLGPAEAGAAEERSVEGGSVDDGSVEPSPAGDAPAPYATLADPPAEPIPPPPEDRGDAS